MFDHNCLYHMPLVQIRDKFHDNPFPIIYSSQFWNFMENDWIEMIVAIRIYPHQDRIAIKMLKRDNDKFMTVILKYPELRILKRIWDCGNEMFNTAIKFYLTDLYRLLSNG